MGYFLQCKPFVCLFYCISCCVFGIFRLGRSSVQSPRFIDRQTQTSYNVDRNTGEYRRCVYMNKSKKFALAASAFLLLAAGYSSVSSGTTEKFVPLSEYNEQFAGQEQILIPINNYNRQFSSLEHSFVPIAEYNDTFSGQIQNFVPLTDYNNTFSGQVQDFVPLMDYNDRFSNRTQDFVPIFQYNKKILRLGSMNIRLHPNNQVTPMPPQL